MENNNELIGPRAHDREKVQEIYELRLEGGLPLYYALLNQPDAPAISSEEVQEAKSLLSIAIDIDPEAVKSLEGKSMAEAKKVLLDIIDRDQAQAA